MKLSEDILNILEEKHFLAYLSTANKEGQPSVRQVGVIPSEDLTTIYVGNGRFNKAEKDLSENKKTMFTLYNNKKDPFEVKGFQIECKLSEIIKDKENSIFKIVYDATKEAVNKEEAELLKSVYIFDIKRIYDCSMEGEGRIVI